MRERQHTLVCERVAVQVIVQRAVRVVLGDQPQLGAPGGETDRGEIRGWGEVWATVWWGIG